MKNVIYLETEASEWDFFREKLADFSLRCVDDLKEVETDAKVVCVFIHSRVDAKFLKSVRRLSSSLLGRRDTIKSTWTNVSARALRCATFRASMKTRWRSTLLR